MNSYTKIIEVLDKAFDHFNAKYCENILSKPLIVVLSRGRKACYGWHWAQKWRVGEEVKTEIMIAAETLDRPWQDILETLLHEMVHLHNAQHNLKDCNAQQYHNKNFRNTATQIFHLNVEKLHQKGYALTSLSDRSSADVLEFIEEQKLSPIGLKRIVPPAGKTEKKQYNINVSKEDFEWFRTYKEEQDLSSKEAFAALRELHSEHALENELVDYR
jgi:SprT-like family